ncbi:MAG: NIPSNAP family containing protein [Acidimicrobiia bacterium]
MATPNEKVYIHELIHVIGHNRNRYMHHMTANWCPVARDERDQLCFGVWATVGSTGDWPQVVNMWELDGWAGLAANFAHEFAGGREQDPSLAEWWAVAADLRRGGHDRIVVPAPWSPPIDALCAEGVRGVVYAHEVVSVAPGMAGEYLDAVEAVGVDAYADFGLGLVGAFATAMRSEAEAILVWAIPGWIEWTEFERAAMDRAGLDRWKSTVRELGPFVTRTLMVDAPLAPLRTGRQPQVEDRRPLAEI